MHAVFYVSTNAHVHMILLLDTLFSGIGELSSMNQTIMQGPSVSPYFATRNLPSGLEGSGGSKKKRGRQT